MSDRYPSPGLLGWAAHLVALNAGQGSLRGFKCRLCGRTSVTVDVDAGIVSTALRCPRVGCPGLAVESVEIAGRGTPTPILEWYRPSTVEHARLTLLEQAVVESGWLLLRWRTARPDVYRDGAHRRA